MLEEPQSLDLRYYALLREERGLDQERMTTQAATPRDLYVQLAKLHRFSLPVDKIGVAINSQFCSLDDRLREGDQVTFIPPVAGG